MLVHNFRSDTLKHEHNNPTYQPTERDHRTTSENLVVTVRGGARVEARDGSGNNPKTSASTGRGEDKTRVRTRRGQGDKQTLNSGVQRLREEQEARKEGSPFMVLLSNPN
jgi:hypothetical protein